MFHIHKVNQSWIKISTAFILQCIFIICLSRFFLYYCTTVDMFARACSVVPDSLRPHGLYVAFQAPLSMEFFQARILEQVVISFSRGFSWSRDRTHISCVSCIGRQVLYQLHHWGNPTGPGGPHKHLGAASCRSAQAQRRLEGVHQSPFTGLPWCFRGNLLTWRFCACT